MSMAAIYSVVNSKRKCQDDGPQGEDVVYTEIKLPDSLCSQNVSRDGKAETEWTQKTSHSRYRLFSLGLGLMFLLLLIIIIFLSVRLHRGNQTWSLTEDNLKQLWTNYSTLAKENGRIQNNCGILTKEKDRLQEDYSFLAKEKEELQDNCNNDKDQLQEENKMLTNSNNLLWNNYNILLNKLHFLKDYCKPGKACTPCPEGWEIFNDKCYYQNRIKKKWEESKTFCSEHGGNLAVIESQVEQVFIKTIVKDGNSWIGLSDTEQEGSWLWVNGAQLKKSFWAKGEPNDRHESRTYKRPADCVYFQAKDGVWFDDDCDRQLNSLCETEVL